MSFSPSFVLAPLACITLSAAVWAQADLTAVALDQKLPIPEKLVVLTFDDSAKSHFTIVRPLLLKYNFGATFFITEGFDFKENKRDYMTWEEIAELHRNGFEIGNHTRDHLGISDANVPQLAEQLDAIAKRCQEHGIPAPVTFAWPGNATSLQAFPILKEHGILFARRGGAPEYPYEHGRGFAFQPGSDHPLLLPSAGDARPKWTLEDFIRAASQARDGRVAILQFHGAPDTAHNWVSTEQQNFEAYMHYLATHEYKVIPLRDLSNYRSTQVEPADPMTIIHERQKGLMPNSTTAGHADDFPLRKRTISTEASGKLVHQYAQPINWQADRTAVILCDVWDYHHSINAVRRLEEMLPRMNALLKEARQRGATIIHAPSDCMPAYEKHAARLRATSAPQTNLPKNIASWCSRIPSEENGSLDQYPIDQSDGGEDDDQEEHRQWAAKLVAMGRNPGMPWKAQSPSIEIDPAKDYISDRGDEVWRILQDRQIRHVILLGVHTNMCVLGRPFGLRQLTAQKMDVVLLRDLTDCMYNPKRWPYVDHFTGNDLVVSYVERFICPSITSDQILGGQPLRFKGDQRTTRDVISVVAAKPNEWRVHNIGKVPLDSSICTSPTVFLRCAIRFPSGSLDEPTTVTVQRQVTGAWLNGQPLDVKPTDGANAQFQIANDLTFGNDDANLLVLQIDLAELDSNSVRPPKLKMRLGATELNGNWEWKAGSDASAHNIPLPAKFGMSPDVFYTLP